MLDKSYGKATIRSEGGKVTHVETETRRTWQYKDLLEQVSKPTGIACYRQAVGSSIRDRAG